MSSYSVKTNTRRSFHLPLSTSKFSLTQAINLRTRASATARFSSALRTDDFRRHIHAVSATPEALAALGPAVVTLATVEGLPAHAQSVALRS